MKELRPEEARQARWGMPVLAVLVAGLVILGIAAFILVPRYSAPDANEIDANGQPAAQMETAAPSRTE